MTAQNFNPNHDEIGRFAEGGGGGGHTPPGGARAHVERAIAHANETIARYGNRPGSRGDGEMRQTAAGMRAWKERLEAAGFEAQYERGSGFTRYGTQGARMGTGLAMYSIEWRRP